MDDISLYLHIPFCQKKCSYCVFASYCVDELERQKYVDFLCKEIEMRSVKNPVSSIYFGGGTPSILSTKQFVQIFDVLSKNFHIMDDAEISVEANPNSLKEELLTEWKNLGVNRVSLGVQSLDDAALKKIGRLQDAQTALGKVSLCKRFFNNLSCDLLVGLQDQTAKSICNDACKLVSAGATHISCYMLEVYSTAQISREIAAGKYLPLSDEKTIEVFDGLCQKLKNMGMERYEISNFAFSGFESRHNLGYWARKNYLGFGAAAHSFWNGERSANASQLLDYYAGKVTKEHLTDKEEDEEKIMLGLRCKLGVDIGSLHKLDITKNQFFQEYVQLGVLRQVGQKVFLSPQFYNVSNTIISNLFE